MQQVSSSATFNLMRTLVSVIATLVLRGDFLNHLITGPVSLTHLRREKKVHCPLLEGLDPMRAMSILMACQSVTMTGTCQMPGWPVDRQAMQGSPGWKNSLTLVWCLPYTSSRMFIALARSCNY